MYPNLFPLQRSAAIFSSLSIIYLSFPYNSCHLLMSNFYLPINLATFLSNYLPINVSFVMTYLPIDLLFLSAYLSFFLSLPHIYL
ncbi:hypothetical protein GDO81_002304 [Engystomops pustulosus]|uniref:Uncharacterized protein n=1 Tax=Engystomops pustulosus TaxID=76066 RepID=A0AAV7DJ19_ENGPU|nr:hypothetical protein GDO81_002304 [Engystomops pustulosus]